MPSAEEPLEVWFRREVLSHDGPLTRFLSRRGKDPNELADLRQETYTRFYEAARRERPRMPRAFLFTIAMHLLTDRGRRARIVTFCSANDEAYLETLVNEISPEQQTIAYIELAQLNDALLSLSPKCREVVWMRRVQGLSQREVAERLKISEKMVEKHLAIGVRRLAKSLRA